MTKLKPGLGRGLDALINPVARKSINEPITVDSKQLPDDDGMSVDILTKIPIDSVLPNPFQPRSDFEPQALDELKRSILENGLIQPITVRRAPENNFELISGERRWRSCKEIGYTDIPAYIIQVDSVEAMLALALIENIQREELNPIEVAKAYKRLLDECNLTQDEISKKVGKDRSTITNSLRLLKLPDVIQKSLINGDISNGHARALLGIPSTEMQINVLEQIKTGNLSVRKVELLVKTLANNKKQNIHAPNKKNIESKIDSISRNDLENKLRLIFGTKVQVKQRKDGAGEIAIDFYSEDELDRLFELFELIEKYNN